ncbi:MAG TPA: HK97 gp10 family phage protein [Acidimicrobiia bacterium]|nr:HK97 gp10 family phage protein [Acidimicrobiia bacterium]
MADNIIQVKGITDLRKALRDISKDLAKELRVGLNEAARIVADEAATKVPRRSGAAAASIKVGSTQTAANVKVGGTAAPYFPWLDFGGSTGRGHQAGEPGSGAVKRPFLKEGRYIYPTLAEKRDEVTKKVDEVLERLAKQAGFDTTGEG